MLAVTPPSRPEEFKLVLDELTEGLMNTADGPLLAAGENLWLGLAGIIGRLARRAHGSLR